MSQHVECEVTLTEKFINGETRVLSNINVLPRLGIDSQKVKLFQNNPRLRLGCKDVPTESTNNKI